MAILPSHERCRPQNGARRLTEAKRVVVKVGSALLVDAEKGRLNRAWLESFAADIARMRKRGQEVILVSSGAIALGRRHLGLSAGKLKLEESQAAAAVGQIRLAHAYKELLDAHEITVAQILLTLGDTEQRRRYLNARGTMNTLLSLGAVPVINENDTVATAEIRYGDNDRLAARVAQMVGADCLVLLSDIDGLYTANPNEDPEAEFIGRVLEITPAIEAMAGGAGSAWGQAACRRRSRPPKSPWARDVICASPRARSASAAAHRGGRALHLVRAVLDAVRDAQAMDRRHAEVRPAR